MSANSSNINFDQLSTNQDDDIRFDLNLTFADKTVLLKEAENENPAEELPILKASEPPVPKVFRCSFCRTKTFKINGIALKNHQIKCLFNPKNFKDIKLDNFKLLLQKEGQCPKCRHSFTKLRSHINICFNEIVDFGSFINQINIPAYEDENDGVEAYNTELLSILPFFEYDDIGKELTVIKNFRSYIDQITDEKKLNTHEFMVLHLNINSIFNKLHEVNEILNLKIVDIFMINETKLDSSVPISFYNHPSYNILRLDRQDKGGGGEIVFIRKGYQILKYELTDFESIFFQIKIKNQLVNFISAYKSPSADNIDFLQKIENLRFQMDNDDPFFLIGDLNMDLKSKVGDDLKNYLLDNDLINYVNDFTRICTSYYTKKKSQQLQKL